MNTRMETKLILYLFLDVTNFVCNQFWIGLIIFLMIFIGVLLFLIYKNNRNKKELKDEIKKYKFFIDNIQEAYSVHDIVCDGNGRPVDYTYIDANNAFEQITGYKIDEIRGKTVKEILPNLEDYWIEIYGKAALDGESVFYENYSSDLNKYFTVYAYGIGKGRFVTIFSDITQHIESIQAIEKEKNILESIIEDTLSGYWSINIKENKEYISNGFKKMLGYTTEEMLDFEKIYWKSLIIEEDLKIIIDNYNKHVESKGKTAFYNQIRWRHKNGAIIWTICAGRVIEWDRNKPVQMVGCLINITDSKMFEQALIEERNLFKTTLLSVGDGVISTDINGNIDLLNNVAEQLTGWKQKDAIGRPYKEVFNIKNEFLRENNIDIVKGVISTGDILELDNNKVLINKDGAEIPIEDRAAPIVDKYGNINGAVIVFRDFSEKKEKQEKIEFLSFHDQLTGLFNRRFFEEEIRRLDYKRNLPLTIIMADVNGLKLTNDAFGHILGDKLLKTAARIIKDECRADDIIARIGGDEFVILLPNTNYDEATMIVNRINNRISKQKVESIILSISFGWATKKDKHDDIETVFKKAEDHMYSKKLIESQKLRTGIINSIIEALDERNTEEKHRQIVENISMNIGKALSLSDEMLGKLSKTALLHDIGKIAINEDLGNKPCKLVDDEWKEIRRHPEIGYRILSSVSELSEISEYVLAHHERWDGKGYPKGIKEEEIPLISRIITIADSYDAMVHERTFKKAMSKSQAIEEMVKNSGTQFDPEIVNVFIEKVLGKSLE